ncbi:MAG: anti-sigma factor family protein [Candidatus Binatia bacterium]
MTCRELTDFLDDHLEGNLPTSVAEEFEDHLSVCPDCRTYVRNYRQTVALARDSANADEPLPGNVPEALVDAVLTARRRVS